MSVKIKVCTFNLRTPVEKDGINYFPNRKGRILDVIEQEKPDLIGFQEVANEARRWLRTALDGYVIVGCGRGSDFTGEAMIIAYKRDAFDLVSMETFWLSTAPSVPGSRYGVDQSSCPRSVTAVVLEHEGSASPFLFLNTHLDHKGATARLLGAIQILQYVSEKGLPFVLTGDFNATPDAPEITAFTACKDREIVDVTREIPTTFHKFGERKDPLKIDYIFTDMPSDPAESYAVEDNPVDGLYISDHRPVIGFVTVE
ncbi:MAG: endonuclease/exonuclease/phosphatase family protein [Clostridia bacterium]|nr:endonuclease/exonuclease/phosphatase family protein [Clostridia bacterium]